MGSRLKSLELQGYKTFASRTMFEFADLITCIVGPNGSGKSNIADSIRWVLGEQSYSLLRAKKTEDMIFSGSELRPRAGMASASITFDNSDGWLPIDFSEVAITRRAYRDGSNEYLINGQRVRLKDVSELLAQSGLAERTYTIIGQGLVDAALALKAEDRRRLFEEAAGIGLHRDRKEEALRRLENTRRNLERAQDILAELEPRLRSLERQARRAVEYEQVRSDLKGMLREWYGYHWHQAQTELSETLDLVRQREARLEAERQIITQQELELSAIRERVLELRTNLNSWHRQMAGFHSQRESLSRSSAILDERIRSGKDQRENVNGQITQFVDDISLAEARMQTVRLDVERLQRENIEARTHKENADQDMAVRQAERSSLENQLREKREAYSELNRSKERLQVRLAEIISQTDRNRQGLLELHGQSATYRQEADLLHSALEEVRQAHAQGAQAREAAQLALDTHRHGLGRIEEQRTVLLNRQSKLSAELARLKAQFDVFQQAEHNMTGYAAGTRLLIETANDKNISGVIGALNEYLDVPEEYETAIASALGEFVNAVLLREEPDAALDLLVERSARGALLPVDWLRSNVQESFPETPGFMGIAANLVSVLPEYKPVVNLLLGRVLVVRDRRAARSVAGSLSTKDGGADLWKIVTLSGEVFYPGGPILAGSVGQSAGGSIISRPRHKRNLEHALSRTEQDLVAVQSQIKLIEDEFASKKQAEADMLLKLQEAHKLDEKGSQDLRHAELAEAQAAQRLGWQQDQANRQEETIAQSERLAEELRMELSRSESDIESITLEIDPLASGLNQLPVEELVGDSVFWNTQVALADQALTSSRSRLEDLEAQLGRSRTAYVNRIAQTELLEKSQLEMEAEKVSNRQAEATINTQIEQLSQLIQPAELELDQMEKNQNELQAAQGITRQGLTVVENQYTQVRINLARRQETLENLRHRIEDDFGLVAFEYEQEISGPTPLPLEGMVEQLPTVIKLSPEIEENIQRLRAQLRRMGLVNPEAQTEYIEVKTRFQFMTEQIADLEKAALDIHEVIHELDILMQTEFKRTFEAVDREFRQIFTRLFGGGSARLLLTSEEELSTTGIEIEARLPGRRTQSLALLSGGERSLTAAALVFSLLKVSPTPFCVLDEVDAMLDEANVARFREMLRELSQETQFVVVTHNRNTVQAAQSIYGITMGRDSTSQMLSLKLDQVAEVI